MKAIVLEIKNGEAAVLREDGIVVTTRQKCRVGDTIEVDDRVKIGGVKRFNRIARLAIVAMLVICIAGGSLGYMTASASSYVSVDAGETSLEFAVNPSTWYVDVPLKDAPIKDDLRIAIITRRGNTIVPSGEDCLKEGDTCVIVTTSAGEFDTLNDIFEHAPRGGRA